MSTIVLDYIKHTCSICGYEVECYGRDEFYVIDELGWKYKNGKMICQGCICEAIAHLRKMEKALTN